MSILFVLLLLMTSVGHVLSQVERREQGNLVIEGIPEIPSRVVDRMFQYQNTRSAYIADWDPAGQGMLIGTRFGETTQLHYVEKPDGARKQITFFPEPVGGGAMCPDKMINGFLFTKDVGGNEFYQIFFYDMDNGEYQMLTDGKSRNGSTLWSNRGDQFVFFSTRRNGRDMDLFLANFQNPQEAKPILEEGGGAWWFPMDWSSDDTNLLVGKYVSINESYCYVLDIRTGELTQIHPTEEKIAYGGALWSKDDGGIYMTSDEGSEFQRLRYYDLKNKKFTILTADIDWDVEQFEISDEGDKLAFVTNEGGVSRLYLLDTGSQRYEPVSGIPIGQIYGLNFHPDGDRLALVINTPQTPGDIYVLNLRDNSLERWTTSEVGGLNTERFAVPELIHYETFDKVDGNPRKMPAFYFKPKTGKGPYPVLIHIHGGPEGQYVPYFSSTFQYYLNELAVAVLAPNVRGSSGYGKSYLKLDNGYKREESVKDIGGLLDWIEKQPELDASRIAVIGGSYGGYMVLASMTHYSDRLKCAVDIVGISNFVTFLENTQEYRRDLRRAEYGDERDPKMREFLNKISPTTNALKITRPMFITQGLNDPRVPVTESEQMVKTIRDSGGEVWYLMAKDEGHGFRKKSNRDYYTNAVVLFLEKYLLQ